MPTVKVGPAVRHDGLTGLGPADLVIPVFIVSTLALPEGNRISAASALLLIGVFVLETWSGKAIRIPPFLIAAALFFTVSAASLLWTVEPGRSGARVATFAYQLGSYIALLNLISWRPKRLEASFTWVVVGALVSGANVVLVHGVHFAEQRTVAGVIPPGQLAIACAAAIAISTYRYSQTRPTRYLVSAALLAYFLAMTAGRRGFLVVVIFLALFYFLRAKNLSERLRAAIVGALLLVCAYAVVVLNPFLDNQVGYRIQSFLGFVFEDTSGDASVQGRSLLISVGMSMFHRAPLIGNGIDAFNGQFQVVHGAWSTSADNNYVEILADLGLMGFFVYYVPLAIFILRGVRGASERSVVVRFAVAFVVAMASVDFATVQIFSKVGMLMVVLCTMAVFLDRVGDASDREDERVSARPSSPNG